VKLDVHYQRKQENIVLSSTANIITIKMKWKYLRQIYTTRFLWSVTSVGPQGRTCARMVLQNTVPLQKPRCSKRTRWCTSLAGEHNSMPVPAPTVWHPTFYTLFITTFHILLGLPSGHFQVHILHISCLLAWHFSFKPVFMSIHYKPTTSEEKAIRQYHLDVAGHCMASGTVINLHMKIIVPGLHLRKCRTHTGSP